eukprot:3643767-Rhodomonas_salina.2
MQSQLWWESAERVQAWLAGSVRLAARATRRTRRPRAESRTSGTCACMREWGVGPTAPTREAPRESPVQGASYMKAWKRHSAGSSEWIISRAVITPAPTTIVATSKLHRPALKGANTCYIDSGRCFSREPWCQSCVDIPSHVKVESLQGRAARAACSRALSGPSSDQADHRPQCIPLRGLITSLSLLHLAFQVQANFESLASRPWPSTTSVTLISRNS